MAAERDSVERYVAAYMEDRVGAVFNARIASVTRFGLFVRLAETGADGILPMRALGAERFRHDQKRHALIGERTRTTYLLGDIVKVRLAEAAPLTGGLRFELVGENGGDHGKISPPVRKSRSRPKRKKSR
jgi:ribonuclease R